ncbi:MAG: cytochrome c3 family protein, partial [Kiloniellaceae bacterium]
MGCVDCHAAPESKVSTDVLLPGIKSCQRCHGGEKAADKVPTTCIACHGFHRRGLPPMKGEVWKADQSPAAGTAVGA